MLYLTSDLRSTWLQYHSLRSIRNDFSIIRYVLSHYLTPVSFISFYPQCYIISPPTRIQTAHKVLKFSKVVAATTTRRNYDYLENNRLSKISTWDSKPQVTYIQQWIFCPKTDRAKHKNSNILFHYMSILNENTYINKNW